MAEGLAKHLFGSKAKILSAGSEPSKINPFAVQAMRDIGIDISSQHSKPIAEALSDDIDLVVTLCADEVCPVVPGSTKKAHWPFSDPVSATGSEAEMLQNFATIRDQIKRKLLEFGSANDLLARP